MTFHGVSKWVNKPCKVTVHFALIKNTPNGSGTAIEITESAFHDFLREFKEHLEKVIEYPFEDVKETQYLVKQIQNQQP